MTDEEMDRTGADTLLELSKTKKEISCLNSKLAPFAEGFKELGQIISSEPESIEVNSNDDSVRFSWKEIHPYTKRGRRSSFELNLGDLLQHLDQLRDATERLDTIKTSLRSTGHAHMVKD